MVMGIASILLLMGVSYFLTYYRNYHFGAEHGTADWGDVRMMLKQLQDPDSMRNTIVSKNISIGLITNIQNSVTPPDAQKGAPFWQDGVGLYLQSLFEYEWFESKREESFLSMYGCGQMNIMPARSLQNSKAGMKLMTPEQVREMPNRDCILLIEGMKPIYDRKNRPFATKQWREAEIAAGPDGYTNPIRILHDKEKDIYKTVDCEEKIIMVDKAEEQFYRNAAATDKTIRFFDIDKEAFLYLNWDEDKPLTMEEIQAIAKTAKKKDVSMMEEPDDVKKDKDAEEAIHGTKNYDGITSRMKWNLKGSFSDCILRYGEQLTPEEMEILSQCLKDGLSDRQMKKILILSDASAMENYRKIFLSDNRSR